MLLVLDVSNRHTAVAVANGSTMRSWLLASDPQKTPDDQGLVLDTLLTRAGFDAGALHGAVIGSVVPVLTATLAEACSRYFNVTPLVVGPGVRTGVRVRTDNPREVGADRIANTLAAYRCYGGPAIVIDCSTATTFDAVSAGGDYLGSVIAPGIEMAMEALARQTAQLHKVELARPGRVIGTNTTSAIQSGVVYGFAGLVDGLVSRIAEELDGQARVIATGPFAELVQASTRSIDTVNRLLTLEGLRLIWEMNARERGAARP